MMKIFYMVFTLCFAFLSCSQDKKMEEGLFTEVMGIHDEVMPLMGTLRSLSKSIQFKVDSLSGSDKGSKTELLKIVDELNKANLSMMEWMRQFEQIEEGTPHGEVMKYLLEQKKMIEKVRDDMLKAKKDGEYYLDNP